MTSKKKSIYKQHFLHILLLEVITYFGVLEAQQKAIHPLLSRASWCAHHKHGSNIPHQFKLCNELQATNCIRLEIISGF